MPATLHTFRDHRILLAVAEPARQAMPETPAEAICYKSALLIKDVLERLHEVGQ